MTPRFVIDLVDTEQDLFDIPRKVCHLTDVLSIERGLKLDLEGTSHI